MQKTLTTLCLITFLSVGMIACKKTEVTDTAVAVNAGLDQTITFPVDSVMVTGSAVSSGGLAIASFSWTQVSGPATAKIVNDTLPSTYIKDLQTGTYLFLLTAKDKKGSYGYDTLNVTVKNAQATLTLQPAANPDEFYLGTLGSFGGPLCLAAENWTVNGGFMNLRFLLKFDLSGIAKPAKTKIVSAKLSLFSHPNPTDGNLVDANFGANNAMLIQRVGASWNKATTTWAAQPAVIATDQVLIAATTKSQFDLVDIDVTPIVQAMLAEGNNGFRVKLQDETLVYNCRLFCSSLYTNAAKRPLLKIVYEGK